MSTILNRNFSVTNSVFRCLTTDSTMNMRDLEVAKKTLYENDLTLAIVKNGRIIFQTDAHRISGFLHAIEQNGAELQGAVVADR